MSYDKSSLDVYGEFSRYFRLGRRTATTHNGQWNVACSLPGCTSQNDALCLWPYRQSEGDNNVTHFWCRRCNKHGDIVTFVALMDGISNSEAAAKLGLVKGFTGPKKPRPIRVNLDEAPSETWMHSAMDFCKECKDILWSPVGKPGLDWLHARGFSDETIEDRWYGFNPRDRFDDLEKWDVGGGKKVWVPRGIVIPWVVGNELWKVNIRRGTRELKKDVEDGYKPRKYIPIKGGSNALYRVNTIRADQPLVILEGEFDADLLSQILAQDGITDVATVATGSTDKGRADNWLVRIARADPILFSFDPDQGGTEAVDEHWRKVLPSGIVWSGIGGDITEMYLAGKDVSKWFTTGLKIANFDALVSTVPPQLEEFPALCYTCLDSGVETVAPYEIDDIMYCDVHRPLSPVNASTVCCKCRATAEHLSPSGDAYCSEHYWCSRGHVPQWVKIPGTDRYICKCIMDGIPEMDISSHGNPVVALFSSLFNATVHVDPPGYTIADRAREKVQELDQESLAQREKNRVKIDSGYSKTRRKVG